MVGDIAKNFSLKDQNGNVFELYNNLNKRILLVFYPKDDSPVCTLQLSNYKQYLNEFEQSNIKIVGINTAIQSATGEFTGVGFAVPSQTVAKIVPSLILNGEYKHPWIGISGRDIDPDLAKVLGLNDAVGFLVVTVIPDSPASKAGLHGSENIEEIDGIQYTIGGDIILSVDGVEVRKISDILIHLQRAKTVGDDLVLEILRDGRTSNFTIVLGERPNGE